MAVRTLSTTMGLTECLPAIDEAMASLQFQRVEVSSGKAGFGNGTAIYRNAILEVQTIIERDQLHLLIRPLKGFSSWRSYDAIGLLKVLEQSGHQVRWSSDDSPPSLKRFLIENLPLLLGLAERKELDFSYFDGVSLKKRS